MDENENRMDETVEQPQGEEETAGENTEAEAPEEEQPKGYTEEHLRQARSETEAALRARFDEDVAAAGIPNPYTGKPFRSFKEFLEYGEQYRAEMLKEQSEKTGIPIAQLEEEQKNRDYLSKQRRAAEKNDSSLEARMRREVIQFQKEFPGVDIGKVEQNPAFLRFAGSRFKKENICDLYRDFLELSGKAQQTGAVKAAGKRARGTGGNSGGGGEVLSPDQQKELDAWNRAYPHMKMTAKEFLKGV